MEKFYGIFAIQIFSPKLRQLIWRKFGKIQAEYKARQTSTQFNNLRLSMICDPDAPGSDFPYLRGKAAENRHLLPILTTLWQEKHRKDNVYERHILKAMENLETFYTILDSKDEDGKHYHHLPSNLVFDLRVAIDLFLTHWENARIIATAPAHNQTLWPVFPKHHKMWHIGFESQFESPRTAMCFGGEDFIRMQKNIAHSVRHGVALHERSKSITQNYLLGLSLKMTRSRGD